MIVIIDEFDERRKKRVTLFSEIKGLACSCDQSINFTCYFCTELAYDLMEILEII